MLPSFELMGFLKWWEGEPGGKPALACYQDQGGTWTIGYGHTGEELGSGYTIDEAEANNLLTQDVDATAGHVEFLIHIPTLMQQRFDALVSFAFNLGVTALANSTLLKYVNEAQWDKAGLEFLKWDHVRDPKTAALVESAGLLKRRHAELMIFQNRDYSARP